MTDRQRREKIARYLNGTMTPAEILQFQKDAASDKRLGTLLEAERLIHRTIERDRRAVPEDHASTRRRVMGMLATLPQTGTSGGLVKGAATGISQMGKIMIVAGIGIGTMLVGTMMNSGRDNEQPAGVHAAAERAQPAIPPAAPTPATDSVSPVPDVPQATAGTAPIREPNAEAQEPERGAANQNRRARTAPTPTQASQHHDMAKDAAVENGTGTEPLLRRRRVVRNDSVNIQVRVDVKN